MNEAFEEFMDEKGVLTERGEKVIEAGIDILAEASWRNSESHGFHESGRPFSEEIALIHSEYSEALEEWRKGKDYDELYFTTKTGIVTGPFSNPEVQKVEIVTTDETKKPEGIGPELADGLIRSGDTARGRGITLGRFVILKHRYNVGRPYKHGKKA